MKVRASAFIKQVMSAIIALAKAKSASLKSKTCVIKTRFLVFTLLRNKKLLMNTVAHKVQALTHRKDASTRAHSSSADGSRPILLYNGTSTPASPFGSAAEPYSMEYGYDDDYSSDDEDEYPDLRHSLFDLELDEEEDELPGLSVIEMAKNSKEERGENFNLEDQIDHVADMFIQRFHKHIRIEQKKRYKEMLQRGI